MAYAFRVRRRLSRMESFQEGEYYKLPVSHEVVLEGHTKVVSALAVDPSGCRVLTGSYDCTIRMYDLNATDLSFRQLEPFQGHCVCALSWSPTGALFLAVTSSPQLKVYDRDGRSMGESIRGDMYIRDLKHTKGHVSGLTCGQWHPIEKNTMVTSSEDGSIRIWDLTNLKAQEQVIRPKLLRPGRVSVTTCAWGSDGKCVAGGLADGSLQIWNSKAGWGSRPDVYLNKAHAPGDDVTAIKFAADGQTLASRSADCTLKIWDLRQMSQPLKSFQGLANSYPQTALDYSPDGRFVVTGTSASDGEGGKLVFIEKQGLEAVIEKSVKSDSHVVCCHWHPRLNQVLATSGCATRILYDPTLSWRGALTSKSVRKKVDSFSIVSPAIRCPHALPLFRDEPSRKRQRQKARDDPVKSRRPDLPVTGPGHGGRIGASESSLLVQHLLRVKESWVDEDPRQAILKHAEAAEKDPKYISTAYAQTQPKPIFAEDPS